MDSKPKPNLFRNIFVRILLFSVLILLVREVYVVTIRGERCDYKDFCFFSLTSNSPLAVINDVAAVPKKPISTVDRTNKIYTSKDWIVAVRYYSSLFQDLISSKYLDPSSKSLCVETVNGKDVYALKEVGVSDAIGISKKQFKPLVVSGNVDKIPFDDDVFDFVFAGEFDKMIKQGEFAKEVSRVLKPEGFVVILTKSNDEYSSNSLIHLFNCCTVVRKKEIKGIDSDSKSMKLHEIVLKKENRESEEAIGNVNNNEDNSKCEVPGYKNMLVRKAEPLILEEPLKPWLTLKRNIKNVKYLPSMADINFRGRYMYVDVGARSYGSSIGSWFRKQYPKQNKTFEVYAIEADKAFHEEYKVKKNVKLLPYAAWVRNETLFFEINKDPGHDKDDREGRGMGRIQPVQDGAVSDVNKIQGFDFAQWLKNTVSEKDFVVMKMDVEGTEFDLIPRLFETGAICLIDEIFLECHYNRWQKCCPGERSPKYEKTYDQCLELFTSLRESGVLVHQWW